jgi:hypothetical protein
MCTIVLKEQATGGGPRELDALKEAIDRLEA